MSTLGAFCTLVVEFFEDISEQYPEEEDIAYAVYALRLLKKTNPRLIHTSFVNTVDTELGQRILAEDEEYVLTKTKTLLGGDDRTTTALWIFDKHWNTMSETNKQLVWKYIKAMVILSARVQ